MSRYAMCPECGRRLKKISEEEYYCPRCAGEDDIPEGCAACGGNYPECISSCPLFDD